MPMRLSKRAAIGPHLCAISKRRADGPDPVFLLMRQPIFRVKAEENGERIAQQRLAVGRSRLRQLDVTYHHIGLPLHIIGIAGGQPLCNVEAVLIGFERAVAVAAGRADVTDAIIADRQIALPFGIIGIAGGQPLSYVEAVLIGFERAVAVAAGRADVTDAIIADRQIALPFGIIGIAGGQPLSYVEAVLIGFERAVAVAAGRADVTDAIIADRQIALPFGIIGIAGGQPLSYVEAVLIGFERAVAVAAGRADVTDLVIAHRQIALPFGIVGIAAQKALQEALSAFILVQGRRAIPKRRFYIAEQEISPMAKLRVVDAVTERDDALEALLGRVDIARALLQLAEEDEPFGIIGVDLGGLGIGAQRRIRVVQISEGALLAPKRGLVAGNALARARPLRDEVVERRLRRLAGFVAQRFLAPGLEQRLDAGFEVFAGEFRGRAGKGVALRACLGRLQRLPEFADLFANSADFIVHHFANGAHLRFDVFLGRRAAAAEHCRNANDTHNGAKDCARPFENRFRFRSRLPAGNMLDEQPKAVDGVLQKFPHLRPQMNAREIPRRGLPMLEPDRLANIVIAESAVALIRDLA